MDLAGVVEPAKLAAGVGDMPAQERSLGGAGVRTRQTPRAILGAAEQHGSRRAILREAFNAIFARGDYVGSVEELTPVAGDPVAAVPVVAALVASLIHPSLWRKFHAGAVGPYAVTPKAWNEILAAAD